MIEEVKNIKFKNEGKLKLNEELVKKSDFCWNKYKKENKNAYNEEIIVV